MLLSRDQCVIGGNGIGTALFVERFCDEGAYAVN